MDDERLKSIDRLEYRPLAFTSNHEITIIDVSMLSMSSMTTTTTLTNDLSIIIRVNKWSFRRCCNQSEKPLKVTM